MSAIRTAFPVSNVVVAVGTDHHPFHRLVNWIDAWAAANPHVTVLVQRGTSDATAECPSVELLPHPELLERFARADAVVSHGGPSTVMDARMVGRFPIVMGRDPNHGEHVDDHQLRFAEHLRRHDLAEVVDSEAALHAAIDEAVANPHHYSVPVEGSGIPGVVEFGRTLDRLLGTSTELVVGEPVPPAVTPDPVPPAVTSADPGSPAADPVDATQLRGPLS
ncbi:MAG: glycosyltransferase [Actinomycetota bacterium]